jgi:hypothetical protein
VSFQFVFLETTSAPHRRLFYASRSLIVSFKRRPSSQLSIISICLFYYYYYFEFECSFLHILINFTGNNKVNNF